MMTSLPRKKAMTLQSPRAAINVVEKDQVEGDFLNTQYWFKPRRGSCTSRERDARTTIQYVPPFLSNSVGGDQLCQIAAWSGQVYALLFKTN